jgi:hypothetical protein
MQDKRAKRNYLAPFPDMFAFMRFFFGDTRCGHAMEGVRKPARPLREAPMDGAYPNCALLERSFHCNSPPKSMLFVGIHS